MLIYCPSHNLLRLYQLELFFMFRNFFVLHYFKAKCWCLSSQCYFIQRLFQGYNWYLLVIIQFTFFPVRWFSLRSFCCLLLAVHLGVVSWLPLLLLTYITSYWKCILFYYRGITNLKSSLCSFILWWLAMIWGHST